VQIRVSRATLENQPCRSPINLKLNIRTLFSPRFAFLSIPDIEQLGSPLNAVTRHLGETFEIGIRYNGVEIRGLSLKQVSFQSHQEVFVAFWATCVVLSPGCAATEEV